jgi:glycosyltransferase involved in cell wall biosynthesis
MKFQNKLFILTLILLIYKLFLFKFQNIVKSSKLIKGKKYLDFCISNNFKHNNFESNNYNYQIKISVIIPVYNCQNSIEYSIYSIQNQNFNDYEIILINDFSKDNSLSIIENLRKEDSRIKIINNNKNMGTLYSRNIGVLASKGKYILALDNDDMFFDFDVFSKMYKICEKKNYDIIGFKAIRGNSYNSSVKDMYDDPFHMHKNNIEVNQPELVSFSLLNNDCHIWGKFINNKIYRKAVNSLGEERFSINISYAEDDIMVFLLFKYANSFKFVSKYGIFHLISNKTASFILPKDHILFCKIYFLDILFIFTKNDFNEKKIVIYYLFSIFEKIFLSTIPLNNENKTYLKEVLKKLLGSEYIIEKDKNDIRKILINITNI